MKKILFLLFTFLFPLSVFAQSEYAMKIKTDSVIYNEDSNFGCTNPSSPNYDPNATDDDASCQSPIEGCTDSTALNYNANATIHKESLCQYSQNNTPQDVTGSFEKSQVSIGATTWTLRFNLNVTGATLDPSVIQTWNRFTAVSTTSNEKTLTLTLRQFDDQRLDVECTNYEVIIPRRAIMTERGDTNSNPITGNFEVVGCEKNPDSQPQDNSENNEKKHENTIKQDNLYLSLYDTDENGKIYVNVTNVVYLLGLVSFFLILFFVLFGFIKNSFL